jgi:hypothetical protein
MKEKLHLKIKNIFVLIIVMKIIKINEKTKTGKNVLAMLKALSQIENDNSIQFLDETEYLLSSKANKEVLMDGISQVKKGKKGKTIEPSELWK